MPEDDPIMAAIRQQAKNAAILEADVSQHNGKSAHAIVERERGTTSYGLDAGISQKQGWSFKAFWKKVWPS